MDAKSILERIEIARRAGLSSRLMKGAKAIGELRRLGLSCSGGWSAQCPCNPRSDFCDAKARWLNLAEDLYGGPPWGLTGFEQFYLAEAMTNGQWDATKLTICIMPPTGNTPIRVGPRGTDWGTIRQLAELYGTQDYPEALAGVLRIQGVGL